MALTPKQEKFCQNIISGMTQTDAYRGAYDCSNHKDETIWNNAHKLMRNSDVLARIEELKGKIEDKLVYTALQSFEKFKELQELAINTANVNAAIKAEENKAKLAGLYVEKQEFVGNNFPKVLVEFIGKKNETSYSTNTGDIQPIIDTAEAD